jgi:mannosyltransferase OCH1-like enzyme
MMLSIALLLVILSNLLFQLFLFPRYSLPSPELMLGDDGSHRSSSNVITGSITVKRTNYDGSIESLLELTQSHSNNHNNNILKMAISSSSSNNNTNTTNATTSSLCPDSLVFVNDTLLSDPSLAYAGGRKIPRIVHISSASRCNDPLIADNLHTWRLDGHYFVLHTDEAVLKLLYDQDWSREFPLLTHIIKCLPRGMGAAWIDLWRLLVLWKFGGIYADLDSSPVPSRFNATTITPEDDAFFVLETL